MLAAIFSRFGLVIYEMVTGTKAFQARSHAGLISAIMSAEPPPLSTVQPMVPPVLEHVVKTCLAKDPQARWQTAHDVLLQLKWISEAGTQVGVPRPVVARRKHRERIAFVTAAVLLVALGALSWIHFTEMRATARLTRFVIAQPEGVSYAEASPLFVSPDGRTVGTIGLNARGHRAIWLRRMGSLEASPLAGTEGVANSAFGRRIVDISASSQAARSSRWTCPVGPPQYLRALRRVWGARGTMVTHFASTGGGEMVSITA